MESSRIFVGNLNLNIENNHLQDEFSHYGTVLNVEIKSKADFEGNIISKFAYVTVESDRSQILKCVNTLNGSSWKGTVLKVDVAKESFLQRLKREREQNLKEKTNCSHVAIAEKTAETVVSDNIFENHKESTYWNSGKEEDNSVFHVNKSVNGAYPSSVSRGIRRYDPTRPDLEYFSGQKHNTTENVTKTPQNLNTTENVTKSPQSLKFVKVSADLNFSGKSNGFSLLERFSKAGEAKEFIPHDEKCSSMRKSTQQVELKNGQHRPSHFFEKQNHNYVHNEDIFETHQPSYYPPPKLTVKKKNFFIQANDPSLSEGVEWLLTPLTTENLEEFQRVRKELVDLYKLRHLRAVREKTKNKGRKYQKHRNRPYKTKQ